MGRYDDIINLPHHVSATRPQMPMIDRAAQFQPFRALTGYEDAVQETARQTDEPPELTEDEKALLDAKLQKLSDSIDSHPRVTLTWFQPDKKKPGGAYVITTGELKKIDDYAGALILMGGERIVIEHIVDIQIMEP
ncbi:hypothetical protein [uncultured Oscillibacter sp.]|uniref:hypothetical protein n=1 Tax=uncultured Oscillibacter sp. TaxID=876091 RepID=UPI0026E30A3B|nr:hypothetical protein [uncultured Oscillibacter sp.]